MGKVNSKFKIKNPTELILRLGLAFVFLYAAIASLLSPLEWSGFLPAFLFRYVDSTLAIRGIAAFQIVLSLWLLSGKLRKYAAALSALTLAGIIAANLSEFIITFRDVGLLAAAIALFFSETEPSPPHR